MPNPHYDFLVCPAIMMDALHLAHAMLSAAQIKLLLIGDSGALSEGFLAAAADADPLRMQAWENHVCSYVFVTTPTPRASLPPLGLVRTAASLRRRQLITSGIPRLQDSYH